VNLDPLEEGVGRAPPSELVSHVAARDLLARDEVLFDVTRVQVIEDQPSATSQRRGDVGDHDRVIGRVLEVSEAREQAEHEVERARPKRLPHVLFEVAHFGAAKRSRACQAAGREVKAGDAETSGGEAPRVTAATATQVEHARTASGLEQVDQPVDKPAGFRLIAV